MSNLSLLERRSVRLMLVALMALGARLYVASQNGIWTQQLTPVPGEANMIAVKLAWGEGYATPLLQSTNLPLHAQRMLPSASPMGHPILTVSGDLPPTGMEQPGYIFLLAGLIRSADALGFGMDAPYRAAALFGIAVSVASIVALAWFAGEHFGPPGEWCAGLLLSFWPRLVRLSWSFWDTPYTTAGLSLCLVFLVVWKTRTSLRCFALYGVFAGILTLFNPATAPVLGVALIGGVWGRVPQGRRSQVFAAAMGVWLLCLSPWFVRNAVAFGRFVPIRNNLGLEMWLGTLPEFDGTTASVMCRHPIEVRSEQELIAVMGEDRYMQMRTRDAVQALRASPGEFVSRTWKRVRQYWVGSPPMSAKSTGNASPLFYLVGWLTILAKSIRLGGAVLGFFTYRDRPTRWVFLAAAVFLPLPYYITHVHAGYGVFLDPFLGLMFTGFVVSLWTRYHRILPPLKPQPASPTPS